MEGVVGMGHVEGEFMFGAEEQIMLKEYGQRFKN